MNLQHFTSVRGGSLILVHKDVQIKIVNCNRFSKIDCFEICGVTYLNSNVNIFCCYQNNNNFDAFIDRLEFFSTKFFQ